MLKIFLIWEKEYKSSSDGWVKLNQCWKALKLYENVNVNMNDGWWMLK